MRMAFPDLRKRYEGRHFRARGYFSTASGNITDDVILQYFHEHEPAGVSRWLFSCWLLRYPIVWNRLSEEK
jgi:putative transposase